MPWVVFDATVGWGCGKDEQTMEFRIRVEGAAEAEELAERLKEYGNRPHRCPEPGDKGVLMVDGSVIHEGNIDCVTVSCMPWSSTLRWDDYDTYDNEFLL
jgi:hypothetical protein